MANSDVLIGWLKDANARAFELEDPNRPGGMLKIDILVDKSTVGVRVRRAGSDHRGAALDRRAGEGKTDTPRLGSRRIWPHAASHRRGCSNDANTVMLRCSRW